MSDVDIEALRNEVRYHHYDGPVAQRHEALAAIDRLEARIQQLEQGLQPALAHIAEQDDRIAQLEATLKWAKMEATRGVDHLGCAYCRQVEVSVRNALSRTEDTPPQHKEEP